MTAEESRPTTAGSRGLQELPECPEQTGRDPRKGNQSPGDSATLTHLELQLDLQANMNKMTSYYTNGTKTSLTSNYLKRNTFSFMDFTRLLFIQFPKPNPKHLCKKSQSELKKK